MLGEESLSGLLPDFSKLLDPFDILLFTLFLFHFSNHGGFGFFILIIVLVVKLVDSFGCAVRVVPNKLLWTVELAGFCHWTGFISLDLVGENGIELVTQ